MDVDVAKELLNRIVNEKNTGHVVGLKECSFTNQEIEVSHCCPLWGGLGNVYQIDILGRKTCSIIVKEVKINKALYSVGDLRKKDSYIAEACFYRKGHAENLLNLGMKVPFPLLVEEDMSNKNKYELSICMPKLGDPIYNSFAISEARCVLKSIVIMHASYWGDKVDEAVKDGLQSQGCYWYLDTRKEEWDRIGKTGWQGRLKKAAIAIDLALKKSNFQTLIHGDLKSANIILNQTESGTRYPCFFDFQYCGKGPPTKDLAYFFTCGCKNRKKAEEILLPEYYSELIVMLKNKKINNLPTLQNIKELLLLSYADLGRWMAGWGWWGNNIEDKIIELLDFLDNGTILNSENDYVIAIEKNLF